MPRQPFISFFSKQRGPPRLRLQVCGIRGKRFYKLVAANQRDPRDGKHMEVLGSYAPHTHSGVEEIRLRFSRIKFWLASGAFVSPSVINLLSTAQLIPTPPPPYGSRTMGHYENLQNIHNDQLKHRQYLLQKFYKNPDPIEFYTNTNLNENVTSQMGDDENTPPKRNRSYQQIRRILH